MALSNIFKEPRREITESLVGILTGVSAIFGWYFGAVMLQHYLRLEDGSKVPFVSCLTGVALLFVLFLVVVYLTHWLGEVVCDWLEDRNLDPRPKQRYN